MKKNFFVVLKIAISIGILYFLFRGMDLNAFLETISRIKPISIVIVVAFILTIQCISTLRWQILLKNSMLMGIKIKLICLFSQTAGLL